MVSNDRLERGTPRKVNVDLHITTLTGILPHQGPFRWGDISLRIGTSSLPSKWGSSTLDHACGGILSGLMLGIGYFRGEGEDRRLYPWIMHLCRNGLSLYI